MTEFYYRCSVQPTFEIHSLNNSGYIIHYLYFPVLSHTSKGVWISYYGIKKFILNGSRKKFAYSTKEQAFIGYLKRTEVYIKILKAKLEVVQEEYAHALNFQQKNNGDSCENPSQLR